MSAVISIHRERFKKVRAVNQGQGHGQLSLTDAHGEQVGLIVSTAETLGLKLCRFRKKGVRLHSDLLLTGTIDVMDDLLKRQQPYQKIQLLCYF